MAAAAVLARTPWLDSARGIAILLVVLHHSVLFTAAAGAAHPAWVYLNAALNTFRMPLFFFVSGLLAANAVRRDWRALLGGRVLLLVWVYVLWSLLSGVWFRLVPDVRERQEDSWSALPWSVLTADTSIWYLYALALFLAAGRAVRDLPTWAVIGSTGLVSLVFGSDLVVAPSWAWQAMATFAFFFFAGIRVREPVLAWARRPVGWRPATAAVVGCAALTGAAFAVLGADVLAAPGVRFVLSVVAVAAGCVVARWASGVRAARGITAVGRLTLPFYVMHGMVVGALVLALVPVVDGPLGRPLGLVAPALVMVVALAVTAALRPAVERVPGALALPRLLLPRATSVT